MVTWDPFPGATTLYVGSFDHGTYVQDPGSPALALAAPLRWGSASAYMAGSWVGRVTKEEDKDPSVALKDGRGCLLDWIGTEKTWTWPYEISSYSYLSSLKG